MFPEETLTKRNSSEYLSEFLIDIENSDDLKVLDTGSLEGTLDLVLDRFFDSVTNSNSPNAVLAQSMTDEGFVPSWFRWGALHQTISSVYDRTPLEVNLIHVHLMFVTKTVLKYFPNLELVSYYRKGARRDPLQFRVALAMPETDYFDDLVNDVCTPSSSVIRDRETVDLQEKQKIHKSIILSCNSIRVTRGL